MSATKALDTPSRCDHKFIDSTHCLKCGWTPPTAVSRDPATPSGDPEKTAPDGHV